MKAGSLQALATTRGAVARADLGLVGLDDGVERGRIDVALLGQHGLQRAHAQLRFRQLGMLVVVVDGRGRDDVRIMRGQFSGNAALAMRYDIAMP